MTNFLISNGYKPVGPVIMGNEMMKQSYYKPNPLEKPAILELELDRDLAPDIASEPVDDSGIDTTVAGKRRKSLKKKKGSKKKNIK